MSAVLDEAVARTALVTFIVNQWALSDYKDVVIYGENLTRPNMDIVDAVVEYDIQFERAKLASMNLNPETRTTGKVTFTFGVREGSGSLLPLQMRSFVSKLFQAKWIDGVRTLVPQPRGDFATSGWRFWVLDIPFRFDSRLDCDPLTP